MFQSQMTFKTFMINEELHSYSSTQINLSDKLGDKIIEWGEENIKTSDLYQKPDDCGREYEPHITVLYGLHAEKEDEVKNLLKKVKSFHVKLGKVSIFTTSDEFDVIKIEVNSPQLHEINKLLRKLPHTNKFPDYKPHITLAYIKKDKCKNLNNEDYFEDINFTCHSIAFSDKNRKKTEIELI